MVEIIRWLFIRGLGTLPAPLAVRLHYAIHHKRIPNIACPRRFTEKIINRKLFDRDPRLPLRADKVAVKDFVSRKVGKKFVIPLIWSGNELPQRDERTWQIPFVIKSNNGSGTNLFVRSETDRNWDVIEAICRQWTNNSHATWAGEWLYTKIDPKLFVEQYVGDVVKLPVDYKFYVFRGRVEYVAVNTDRESDFKRTFYDRNWNRMEFTLGYKLDERNIDRPSTLSEMIAAAESLAEDFAFVRVDLYEIEGEPKFGEMTFYPDAGIAKFEPDMYDFILGKLWK